MTLTKERIMDITEDIQEFTELAEQRAIEYLRSKGISEPYPTMMEYQPNGISVSYETYRFGDWERESEWMPIEYLWDDNWYETQKEITRKAKEEKKARLEAEAEKSRIAHEKSERAELERLKTKYEKENDNV